MTIKGRISAHDGNPTWVLFSSCKTTKINIYLMDIGCTAERMAEPAKVLTDAPYLLKEKGNKVVSQWPCCFLALHWLCDLEYHLKDYWGICSLCSGDLHICGSTMECKLSEKRPCWTCTDVPLTLLPGWYSVTRRYSGLGFIRSQNVI